MPPRRPPAPPPPADDGPHYVDEDHQRIAEFAEDYVPEDQREAFLDYHMGALGYTKVSGWGPRADPGDDGGQGDEPDPEPGPPRRRRSNAPYFKR